MSNTGTGQDVARERLGMWFETLDPIVKGMFEQLAVEQPELVYRVISGGTVQPEAGTPLGEHLKVDDRSPARNSAAEVNIAAEVVVEPASPEPGTPFTVRWEEQGGAGLAGWRSTAAVMSADGAVVVERELTALSGPGAREVTFDGGVAAEGQYYVLVTANADGAEYNEVAGDQGRKSAATSGWVNVGRYQEAAGPSTQQGAYTNLANEVAVAVETFASQSSSEALNGLIDAASRLLATAPADANMAAQTTRLDNLRNDLRRLAGADGGWNNQKINDAIVYLRQAAQVFSQLTYSIETFTTNGSYLVDTIDGVIQAYG